MNKLVKVTFTLRRFFLITGIFLLIMSQFSLIVPNTFSRVINPVFDEMDINNPIVVYGYNDIIVNGSYAFCIGNYCFFTVYDIATASNPTEIPIYFHEKDPCADITGNQIEYQNNTLYTFGSYYSEAILYAYNMSNFNNVTFLSGIGIYKNQDLYRSISNNKLLLEDNIAYSSINWWERNDNTLEYTLALIDTSNNSDLDLIGCYNSTGYVVDFIYSNNIVYLIQQEREMFNSTLNEYKIVGENVLQVLNVTNKSNPELILHQTLDDIPNTLLLKDNNLIVAYAEKGIELYDLFDLDNLIPIGGYYSIKNTRSMKIKENSLFALTRDSLYIFDISDINNIDKLAKETPRFKGEGGFTSLSLDDNIAFASRVVNNINIPLIIFDCSVLDNPKEIYPLIISDIQRNFWIVKVVLGYILSPLVILLILVSVFRRLIKKRDKTIS